MLKFSASLLKSSTFRNAFQKIGDREYFYNPFTNRVLGVKSKAFKGLSRLGFERHADGYLILRNRELLRPIVESFVSHRNVHMQNSFLKCLPKKSQEQIIGLAELSESTENFLNKLENFIEELGSTYLKSNVHTESEMIDFNSHGNIFAETINASQLTDDQRVAVRIASEGYNVYIGGSAGTGKTVVLRQIIHELSVQQKRTVAVTASTGVAASNLNGYTFHHIFGLDGLKTTHLKKIDVVLIDEVSMIQSELITHLDIAARITRRSSVPFGGLQVILCGDFLQLGGIPNHPIFFNELFLKHFVRLKLTVIHRVTSDRKVFVDHLQAVRKGILPHDLDKSISVVEKSTCLEENEEAIYIFPRNIHVFSCNQRRLELLPEPSIVFPSQMQDVCLTDTWTDALIFNLKCHEDKSSAFIEDLDRVLRESLHSFSMNEKNFQDLQLSVYPIDVEKTDDLRCAVRARLMSLGLEDITSAERSFQLNNLINKIYVLLQNMGYTIVSKTPALDEVPVHIQTKLKEMAQKEVFFSPLETRIGARVMLRWNFSRDLVNGSVGTIENFIDPTSYIPPPGIDKKFFDHIDEYCRFLHSQGHDIPLLPLVKFSCGETIMIPPIAFPIGGDSSTNFFYSTLLALPIQLAYAFTVHKVQGLTLTGDVVVDFQDMFQCPHLVYVALSRVRKPEQLTIRALDESHISADPVALSFDDKTPPAVDIDLQKLPINAKPNSSYKFHIHWA